MPAPGQASSLSLEGCPAPSSVSLACLHTAWMGLKLPLPCSPALNFSFCPGLNPSTKPGTCFRPAPASRLSTQPLFSFLCPLPRLSSAPRTPSPPCCQLLLCPLPFLLGSPPLKCPHTSVPPPPSPLPGLYWLVLKVWPGPLVENPHPAPFPRLRVAPFCACCPPQVRHPGGCLFGCHPSHPDEFASSRRLALWDPQWGGEAQHRPGTESAHSPCPLTHPGQAGASPA